jgi:hypothetical protein
MLSQCPPRDRNDGFSSVPRHPTENMPEIIV